MKKPVIKLLCMVIILVSCLAGCGGSGGGSGNTGSSSSDFDPENPVITDEMKKFPQFQDPTDDTPTATIKTNFGDITIMFFPKYAPKAVENFLTHAENGYYDGVIFHRVVDNFMIQGGDPEGTGSGGESIWGTAFEDEFSNKLFNVRGALSMANSGSNTNGSQFFIVQGGNKYNVEAYTNKNYPLGIAQAYAQFGGADWLDQKHTVFGMVTQGMDVVDTIAALDNGNGAPSEEVIIETIVVH